MAEAGLEGRVLIAAPTGRDAEVLERTLAGARIDTAVCCTPAEMCRAIGEAAAAAVVAEELLSDDTLRRLAEVLLAQPEWSDFPLVVMARTGAALHPSRRLLERLEGHVHPVVLQRPVRKVTLVSTVQAALQSRQRQYQVRDELARRRRMEASLRESERRFRQLAEAMPQLVWTAGADGTVDYFNERASEFPGIEKCPDGSWTWQPVLHPDDAAPTVRAWQEAVDHGRPYQCEHRMRVADGAWRWHLSRAEPVRDDAGAIVKWYGTGTDIHDVKRAEKLLRDADRRKNEFLATLAHELRNPLAPIRNAVHVIGLKAGREPALESACGMVERQVAHMVRLIDDLLDVSRITRGKVELQHRHLDLREVLEEVLATARPALEADGHHLNVTLPAQSVSLDADPVRLAQAFLNLLDNARKYTPEPGQITLSVTSDAGAATVTVADTGIGIPPEHLPQLFEMFSQVEGGGARAGGGLGIGLWLTRGLVELHGGAIEARSAGTGAGTEIVVRLPLAERPAPLWQPPRQERPRSTTGNGRRILVADDHEAVRVSLAELLALSGHRVETACNGAEAMAVAERCRPDVALLDIGMPDLDGYAVCRRIRAQPWGQDMVIMALTGWGDDAHRERSDAAGFDDFLVKPVKPASLLQLLGDTHAHRN